MTAIQKPAVLSHFTEEQQRTIMGAVGSRSRYEIIPNFIKAGSDTVAPVRIPGILTQQDFVWNVVSFLSKEEEKKDYLAALIVEVVPSFQAQRWLVTDSLVATIFKNLNCSNQDELLKSAAANGHMEIVRKMCSRGINGISVTACDQSLQAAAKNGHHLAVRELLPVLNSYPVESIVSLSFKNAFESAVQNGHHLVVRELLNGGAVIGSETRGKAIVEAAKKGHLAVIQELLSNKAVISAQYRKDASTIAQSLNHLDIMKVLQS